MCNKFEEVFEGTKQIATAWGITNIRKLKYNSI